MPTCIKHDHYSIFYQPNRTFACLTPENEHRVLTECSLTLSHDRQSKKNCDLGGLHDGSYESGLITRC